MDQNNWNSLITLAGTLIVAIFSFLGLRRKASVTDLEEARLENKTQSEECKREFLELKTTLRAEIDAINKSEDDCQKQLSASVTEFIAFKQAASKQDSANVLAITGLQIKVQELVAEVVRSTGVAKNETTRVLTDAIVASTEKVAMLQSAIDKRSKADLQKPTAIESKEPMTVESLEVNTMTVKKTNGK